MQELSDQNNPCPLCGHKEPEFWLHGSDRFNAGRETHRLVRCTHCWLVWLQNPPHPEEMGKHYGPRYDRFIGRAGDNSSERWRDRREAITKHKSSGAILDLGCSSGAFLETLKGRGWELFGIEMSEGAAKQATARSGAKVFVGDILDAPFAPSTFDVITCFDVLEHVYEPRKVLEKVRQWLKPGGIFYVLVPNIECGEARLFKSYWYGLELPRHLSHFSPRSLKYVADSVGLNIASLETHRNSAMENSLHYLGDTALSRIGISRESLADAKTPGIPWKITRKLLRWTVFYALYHVEGAMGPGESIHAVFQAPPISEHASQPGKPGL
jgi:2-polyprenyl-3-methyl-5-hydroxy-6-metoxy-1,4-benzoquinol methylase